MYLTYNNVICINLQFKFYKFWIGLPTRKSINLYNNLQYDFSGCHKQNNLITRSQMGDGHWEILFL